MLRISPGPDDQDIQCALEYTSFIDPGSYSALSYCWGDPKITKKVTWIMSRSKLPSILKQPFDNCDIVATCVYGLIRYALIRQIEKSEASRSEICNKSMLKLVSSYPGLEALRMIAI
jgi:hypothetical protein